VPGIRDEVRLIERVFGIGPLAIVVQMVDRYFQIAA
jgi:hypothetical protein